MDQTFPHLPLQREELVREKRPMPGFGGKPPDDPAAHARDLLDCLDAAREEAATDEEGFDERRIFRFSVQKGFDPQDLTKISSEIEFVSQEDETVVIGFASNAALAQFEARLSTMANGEYVKNKQVIYALQGVDGLKPEDRKGWALKKQGFPVSDEFLLDVELWPMEDNSTGRDQECAKFEEWLAQQGFERMDQVKKPGLTLYRVRCDSNKANQLLRHRDVRSVDLPPSFGLERSLVFQDIQNFPEITVPGERAPGVVVLDSGLATGHPLLGAAVGDAQSFLHEEEAQDENGHGTHVAGLALYGDFERSLRDGIFVPALRLFSGKILDKDNENSTGFVENHIENAVHYFVENYNCRIFNLSFGDSNKPYLGGHLKGLSMTLDTLSRELGVLFVVSAGNHRIGEESPDGLEWRDNYPNYLLEDAWRIIEPAPALNALTVGSLARYNQTNNSQLYPLDPSELPIAKPDQPSPFTRSGYSVDGAIKPELVAHGGNWAINTRAGHRLMEHAAGLGVVSTSHQFAKGHPFAVEIGTSMAAPQVAHLAAFLLREYPDANTNFIRALLCLNAVMPEPSQELIDEDKLLRRICGYGQVHEAALHRSLENAVTLIADGLLENKRHHFYEIPIPDDLTCGGNRRLREIAVALAYTPPVRSTRIKYRATRIDFRLVSAPDLEHVSTMFNKATEKKDYKNIPELKTAAIGQQARSKGTVQADFWRFRQFSAASKLRTQKLFVVVTRNDFPWGENLCDIEEEYSLVVSLRDRENEQARLYSRLKIQIEARLPVRVKV
ncbi:MAG: S8 family peptidase [Bacteroidota bacterium]